MSQLVALIILIGVNYDRIFRVYSEKNPYLFLRFIITIKICPIQYTILLNMLSANFECFLLIVTFKLSSFLLNSAQILTSLDPYVNLPRSLFQLQISCYIQVNFRHRIYIDCH